MTKMKKIVFSAVAVVLAGSLAAGGILMAKKAGAESVMVVPVQDLSMYMGGYEESMEGQVSTSATQHVKLEDDAIIQEAYVSQGDHVKRGDRLFSLDMTLKEMQLEIDILTRQQQQQELKKAKERLERLENGGPIDESGAEDGHQGPAGDGELPSPTSPPLFQEDSDGMESPEDLDAVEAPGTAAVLHGTGMQSASAAYGGGLPLYWGVAGSVGTLPLSFQPEPGVGEPSEEPGFFPENTPTPTPTPTPTQKPSEGPVFYQELTGLHQAYGGTGTKEDPYLFLCSSRTGEVTVKGSFLNAAAGYDEGGTELLKEGGYWYRLEFHEDDEMDPEDPFASLTGFYLRNGGLLKDPVDPEGETVFSPADALNPDFQLDPEQVVTPAPTEAPPPDDGWDDGWDDGGDDDWDDGGESSMTREEAIKQQKKLIKDLELQVKASDLKISRGKRELEERTVFSKVTGTVISMGDPVTGTHNGDYFMEIQSDGGFFINGSLSELMLDTLKVGDSLTCMSFESGNTFQAEIMEVSEYPTSQSSYYGNGNSNASFYPFVASVQDQVELKNGEYVNITLNAAQMEAADKIEIMQAFVRKENGRYYVFKEEDGRLKKQFVDAKSSTDGYSIQILSGVTWEDRLAFPYGKEVKEGAKTREGSVDELYGVY